MKIKAIFAFSFFLLLTSFSSAQAIYIQGSQGATGSADKPRLLRERTEARATISAEIQAKREEFVKKLQEIKDQKKQNLVQKISDKINEINQKKTTQMMEVLDKMGKILDRIESEATLGDFGTLGSLGSLENLIKNARSAIETAKTAVQAQQEKEYVVLITTEGNLRINVGQTVSMMENDVRTTRQKVIDARKAVFDAVGEFMKMRNQREASGSGSLKK